VAVGAVEGEWTLTSGSSISLKTSRIGLMSLHAKAPVVEGAARISEGHVELSFVVAIDQVDTGNPLLDPEVHALVRSGSDGRLTFTGSGAALSALNGQASAGNISVPLELTATPPPTTSDEWHISGQTSFRDIRLPLPGLGHIKHVDVNINGLLALVARTADAN